MERLTLVNLRQRTRHETEPQTRTIIDQWETEQKVRKAYYEQLSTWKDNALNLFTLNHINYLNRRLINLPTSFEYLDASQPWLTYWIVHALRLLNFTIADETKTRLINLLKSIQHPEGGFGGGPHQYAHLATTYGAINCLVSLCRADALQIIDRPALTQWLYRLRQRDGSFVMHIGGEADVRGVYCALAVSKLTGILQFHPDLFSHTPEWIARCQTYEGGFGGHPGLEAHGGYAFCAIAALCLLNCTHLVDIPRLLRWLVHRQMSSEGGFQGRTNKLVDSCYSFWQGASFPIIEDILNLVSDPNLLSDETLFNVSALQEYILLCCQKVSYTNPGLSVPLKNNFPTSSTDPIHMEGLQAEGGGLVDKPGRNADCYHTCYALAGLSIAQHCPRVGYPHLERINLSVGQPNPAPVVHTVCEELMDLDPVHNILHDGLTFALAYFRALDDQQSLSEAERLATEAMGHCTAPTVVRHTSAQMNIDDHNKFSTLLEQHEVMKNTCSTP